MNLKGLKRFGVHFFTNIFLTGTHLCRRGKFDIIEERESDGGREAKMRGAVERRQIRRWRRSWAKEAARGLRSARRQRLLRLCLAAALMAEGLWFAAQTVSFEQWETKETVKEGDGESQLIRGLQFEIEDGRLRLFQIREYGQPEE